MIQQNKSKEKKDKNDMTVIGNIASEKTSIVENLHASNEELHTLSNELEKLGKQRANCTAASTGGYAAEVHHKHTFESDAIKKGHKNIIADLGPRGGNGSKGTADLKIVDNGKVVGEAGLKYRSKATETAFDQSNVLDNGRQKICPADQVIKVKELSEIRANTGTLKAQEYRDTSINATDRLKYKDIESLPLSKVESMEIVKDPTRYSKQALQNDIKVSAKSGAIGGAVIGGVISLLSNTVSCAKGEKDAGDAAADIVKDTTVGAVKGATIGAGSQVVKQTMIKAGAESLAKGSFPIMIASTALEASFGVAKEAKKLLIGEQGVGGFTINSTGHSIAAATKGGAAYAGAELGASIGILGGPAGVFIGGLIGGTVGFIAGDSMVKSVKNYFGW
jgi:hypothetical protein